MDWIPVNSRPQNATTSRELPAIDEEADGDDDDDEDDDSER